MDADLDTLVTALYVTTDDFLTDNPQHRPWRPNVGITPRLDDAELVTLVVLQALLGFTSEARWLRYANSRLRGLFPYLPTQSGYNERVRAAAGMLRAVIAHPVACTSRCIPSRMSRSSALAPVSANATGSPDRAHTRCRRNPQKKRECEAQYPYSAHPARSERFVVSRDRPHSTGVESTTHTSSVHREVHATRCAMTARSIPAAARTRSL